jgi:hypothetical protein
MHSILNFDILLPIGLLLLQAFLLLFICIFVLRRIRLLKIPYGGMEYSEVIVAAMFLFSVFFISTANIEGLFQAFKTFQNQQENVFSNTFSKFSQFFLVILLFELLFGIVSFFIIRILLGFKSSFREIQEGSIPSAILTGVLLISFAVLLQFSAKEVIQYITPQYLNFR